MIMGNNMGRNCLNDPLYKISVHKTVEHGIYSNQRDVFLTTTTTHVDHKRIPGLEHQICLFSLEVTLVYK